MNSPPAISVIIPLYNRAGLIGQAIDSVLSQTFADFEVIVIDDGSNDGSAEAVEAVGDRRIRLIRLAKNGGSNAARNAGIEEARGAILTFLDSDDLYLPGKLAFVAEAFAADPRMDVLVDSFVKITAPGARRSFTPMVNPRTCSTDDFTLALFRRRLWKATSAIAVRRAAAVRAGLFTVDIRQRQDFDFLIRLTETAECRSTDEVLWVKSWTADRITSRARFTAATLELVRRHPQYYADRRFRPGLALDLTFNAFRRAREGQSSEAMADMATVWRSLGTVRTARLIASGVGQAIATRIKPRRRPLSKALSDEGRRAVEAAQSRASARS